MHESVKPWPLIGYAPGDYQCRCADCDKLFVGDKRAVQCLECAASAANAILADRARPPQDAKPVAWQRIDHPHRPSEADYEVELLQKRLIEMPQAAVSILTTWALMQPSGGSYAGTLWALAEWAKTQTVAPPPLAIEALREAAQDLVERMDEHGLLVNADALPLRDALHALKSLGDSDGR